ncbi:hypothetical protein CMI47_21500 [Candidatus Pacearchaeota archaeon]|jgi:hypothetical protein|nr:hypothetical protein [Candidatus Pacearchaeota archaeon]|tara:strand:+ start:947 stop:1456 length:510 start_codon:yes stop_codon:yes gene_type:complete
MDHGIYNVKNIKTIMGTDGLAYNATLYRDKKRVATLMNSGSGGETSIHWLDHKKPRVEVKNKVKDKVYTFNGTPEEKLLYDYVNTLPNEPCEYFKEGLEVSVDYFVGDLVEETDENNRFKRMCKKKTLVRMKEGDRNLSVFNIPYDPNSKKMILKEYPDAFEFINEKYL